MNSQLPTTRNPSIEILLIDSEEQVSPEKLKSFVEQIDNCEQRDFTFKIFNETVFDSDSFIFKYDGQWLFFHCVTREIMSWDFEQDLDALFVGSDYDDSDIEMINISWRIYQGQSLESNKFYFDNFPKNIKEKSKAINLKSQ